MENGDRAWFLYAEPLIFRSFCRTFRQKDFFFVPVTHADIIGILRCFSAFSDRFRKDALLQEERFIQISGERILPVYFKEEWLA